MNYLYIKKHLGEERLRRELKFIEKGEWLNADRKKEEVWLGNFLLKMIDELIRKNESVVNFQKWTKEAKESKNLKDCLFELSCIDKLSKNNKIIIKQRNDKKVPDVFIESEKIYIEMTNLENIPQSIELKVNDLCQKSQERFGDSLGIHLIGINGLFEYSKEHNKMVARKESDSFITDLRKKLQELNKNILCFILFHNYIAYHPNINELRWYRKVPYIIYNGDVDIDLLKRIVGEFRIIQR